MTTRVAIIGAGGTIAMEGAHPFDWIDYGDTGIVHGVEAVLAQMDIGLPDIELMPVPFRALPSVGITPADWLDLARLVAGLASAEEPPDGIVVTHGTASLEETAFFLSLVHRSSIPVVVVGAQRPPSTASSDAAANLRAAVSVAAQTHGGVFVVMDGYAYGATDVSKVANHTLGAFAAPEFGPVARIEANGTVTVARATPKLDLTALELPSDGTLPRVDLSFSYAGADGAAIRAFRSAGAKGIVSAGFPPGRCTPKEREALLEAVADGVLVIQSSRALVGRVPLQAYNAREGILSGGSLSPSKARILAMLALACRVSHPQLQEILLAF